MNPFSGISSILILVPHADDECLGCAAAISRARAGGARVHALYLTTGVASRASQWPWQRSSHGVRLHRRRCEAEAAASLLGLNIVAYGDVPARELRHHLDTALATACEAATKVGAEQIWVPAFEGGHQDHDAANALAATMGHLAPVWEFSLYNNVHRQHHTRRFPVASPDEVVLHLDPDESAKKGRLLACYTSQAANLAHIVGRSRQNTEAFRPLPRHDYSQPPHPGTLFYTRFQWVPFAHPRVDFTPPTQVYATLASWIDRQGKKTGRTTANRS